MPARQVPKKIGQKESDHLLSSSKKPSTEKPTDSQKSQAKDVGGVKNKVKPLVGAIEAKVNNKKKK